MCWSENLGEESEGGQGTERVGVVLCPLGEQVSQDALVGAGIPVASPLALAGGEGDAHKILEE